MTAQRIRVGLIGLNAPYTGAPTGASWCARAHLPYLQSSSKYEIVALHNSSAERASAAIKAYGLNPDTVKAYGTPEDLANDPDVDLVVSSIRVDRHGASIIPSIKAGKDVYVEWPLEANGSIARELAELVKTHNVRNVVGAQGGFSPFITKTKELIKRGEIGKIESSTLVLRTTAGPTVSESLAYFASKDVGGNLFTIPFGHTMEFVTSVLGEVASHHSLMVNQYPEVDIVSMATKGVVEKGRHNDVPNQIVFNAIMKSGAVFTYNQHGGPDLSGGVYPEGDKREIPVIEWRIFGTEGEIRITGCKTWALAIGSDDLLVQLRKANSPEVIDVDLGEDEFAHLPPPARSIARLYEEFADNKNHSYLDFQRAAERHELMEDMYKANGF